MGSLWLSIKKIDSLENALLSTLAILISFCFIDAYYGPFKREHIILIIAAQSIGGIYLTGSNRIRFLTSFKFSTLILCLCIVAFLAQYHITILVLSIIWLAFNITYCFRFFPKNAGDLIIPASLIFFFVLSSGKNEIEYVSFTFIGCVIGSLCQLFFALFLLLYKKTRKPQRTFPNSSITTNQSKSTHSLKLNNEEIFYSIRLAVMLLIGIYISEYSSLKHSYWIPFSIVVLSRISLQVTHKRILSRIGGTLLGCIIAYLIFSIQLPKSFLFCLIVIVNGMFVFYLRRNYAVATFYITLFVLLQSCYEETLDLKMTLERFCFTVLSGVLVFGFSYVEPKLFYQKT
ncbi:FUSC family protein [Flavobacterium salmonis]|uniref:Integral membrane bound transporter domain-containing protein n=1 Tax=Flavobacterium salmonis TaxID=2654844 RepID=A0A6V6Z6F8_9FLAO|nr:FUSC family protein [Flavobacterium salmonis]CAD0007179.1 hypothetical protein FLAT13_03677 [Flavobacterium salmonis]